MSTPSPAPPVWVQTGGLFGLTVLLLSAAPVGLTVSSWVRDDGHARLTWGDSTPSPMTYHVFGDSMFPFVRGPWRSACCDSCGQGFALPAASVMIPAVGATSLRREPEASQLLCGFCGQAAHLAGETVYPESQLIERPERIPQRWDLVMVPLIQEGGGPLVPSVKRLIGFPGEWVRIRDGDIYIDDAIVVKTPEQRRSRSLVVHRDADSVERHAPASPWFDGSGSEKSRWIRSGATWSVTGAPAETRRLVFDPLAVLDGPWDLSRVPPIRDSDPFNGNYGGTPVAVRDWWLRGALALESHGRVVFTLTYEDVTLSVTWSGETDGASGEKAPADGSPSGRIRLVIRPTRPEGEASTASEPLAEVTVAVPSSPQMPGGRWPMGIGRCDGRAFVEIDGTDVVSLPVPTGRDPVPIGRRPPVVIETDGISPVALSDLTVERDIYDRYPAWASMYPPDDGGGWQLGSDDAFVLGDNPVRSWDSRQAGVVTFWSVRSVDVASVP